MATGIAAQIRTCLNEKFVFADDLTRVLSLAFIGKQNVILWGPGGHGKSMMVETVLRHIGMAEESYYLSFGEGMDEAKLWGGLNFQKLEDEKVLEYYPERSFLAKRIAVFEELFDAPAQVLLSLKDTLTAKKLRKGAQSFPMQTEVIVACTNRDPRKFAENDPAAAALVERFPLQLQVRWGNYDSDSYASLYRKLGYKPEMLCRVLGELMARLGEQGFEVSPRTAVHAINTVFSAMKADGDREPKPAHLSALRFVVGFETQHAKLSKEIERAMIEIQVRAATVIAERVLLNHGEIAQLDMNLAQLHNAIRELNFAKDEMDAQPIPDNHVSRITGLRLQIDAAINRAGTMIEQRERAS